MNTTEALLKAMKAEREGYGFYMMAAQSSSDEKGKKIFETLASEELDHMHFLKGQYDAIVKTGKPDPNLKLGTQLDLGGSFPIFSDAIKSRLKGAHIEMSALAIGIQLELDAMNFYKTQALGTADPGIKKFFETLADWESGHYHALLRQETALKEDYWSESGFAPF
jgi:rubrerythrin